MERQPSKNIATILSELDPVKYKAIIERAAANGYHDFKYDKVPDHPEYDDCICPKSKLVDDLSEFPELSDLRKRVIHGEFDDDPDEIDHLEVRNILFDEQADDFIFNAFGFEVPTGEDRVYHELKKTLN